MHHRKVRAAPAIFPQEQLAVFAANFVRWAAHWLPEQCPQLPSAWQNSASPKVKEQVPPLPLSPSVERRQHSVWRTS